MPINLLQGALAALILQRRNVSSGKVLAGAGISAVTQGPLGLLMPLLLAPDDDKPNDAPQELLEVPDVVGRSEKDATDLLGTSFNKVVETATVKGGKGGTVLRQQPAGGTLATAGSTVTLSVQVATNCKPAAD